MLVNCGCLKCVNDAVPIKIVQLVWALLIDIMTLTPDPCSPNVRKFRMYVMNLGQGATQLQVFQEKRISVAKNIYLAGLF